jgi:hypothetical protein
MSKPYRIFTPDILRNYWTLDSEGCWIWLGRKYPNGYGRIGYQGSEICSHRLSWIVHRGQITDELMVLHKCDNPKCINPDHLFLGTQADNMHDMVTKNRQQHGSGHYASKITEEIVRYIRNSSDTGVSLSKALGVSTSLISMIRSNSIWKSVH